jgi:hypothetical protein
MRDACTEEKEKLEKSCQVQKRNAKTFQAWHARECQEKELKRFVKKTRVGCV